MQAEFEAVIGLEVHCQLSTESKIFCACRARLEVGHSVADVKVNSMICPICAGHPGTLPTLNQKVVEYAIRAGLALHCTIEEESIFARKHYFYPDLPKGYQISQYDQPLCKNGWFTIQTKVGSTKKIGIQRIHLEEDAGKTVHLPGFSLVNLNRAGIPLIEIVSHPDINTPEEAGTYLRGLYAVVTALDICDGNLQEGNFRCDANISVMPKGSKKLGTRVEVKNVNSFRFIEKAIHYETLRQTELIHSGAQVLQETRTYDSVKGVTLPLRSKEEAQDYRYFPEPDLLPLKVKKGWIEKIREKLPELPEQKKARFISEWDLPAEAVNILTSSKSLSLFYEQVLDILKQKGQLLSAVAKPAANWIITEVSRLISEEEKELHQSQLKPEHIADVVCFTLDQTLSSSGAKQAIAKAWQNGENIQTLIEREGLRQMSDFGFLQKVVDEIVTQFPQQVAEYRSGKEKLLGFFVGQAMKKTMGTGNPSVLQELFKKKIDLFHNAGS